MSLSETPLLPPPEQLTAGDDYLQPRGLADWLMCPWMSEKLRCLILPLRFGEERLLLAWDGCATVHLPGEGSISLKGRTGEFGSMLGTSRRGMQTVIKGFLDDQTVDYTVDESEEGVIRIDGDTGKYRSRYVVGFRENEAFCSGDHGEFDSNFTARFLDDGSVKVEGSRNGEPIDLEIYREGSTVRMLGAFLGSHTDFSLAMLPTEWQLQGLAYGDQVKLGLKLESDGIAVSGVLPRNYVNFKILRTAEGYWFKGKTGNFHLNYRLTVKHERPPEF